MEVAEYVLCDFDQNQRPQLDDIRSRAAEALVVMLSEGLEAAMNRYQKKR
jgi:peptidyl-tRNA hydrolase